jgi:hypothetical protein
MKYLIFIIAVYASGCDYHQDKLLIQNNTLEEVCSELLIQNKVSGKFQEVAANLEIKAAGSAHPTVRNSISFELNNNSADSTLYLVFHKYRDRDYIFKNINSIIFDKRFTTSKYSCSKLDSLNWTIKYNKD